MGAFKGGYKIPPYCYTKRNGKSRTRHRIVIEEHLGRPLRSDEHIHHKSGNVRDNRIENLEILSNREHRLRHIEQDRARGECFGVARLIQKGGEYWSPARREMFTCPPEFISVGEVAKRMEVTRRTVERWIRSGLLPHPIVCKTFRVWRRAEFEVLASTLMSEPCSQPDLFGGAA